MVFTNRAQKYLAKKKTGGEANQRGNTFEKFFAINEIIRYANRHFSRLQDFFFSTQVDSFVDDLLIEDRSLGQKNLFQLKTSHSLSWGKSQKIKTLAYDFNQQRRRESASRNSFALYLVVTNKSIKKFMERTLPSVLRNCTSIRLFPYHESINLQLQNDPDFRKEVEQLCAFSDLDKLEALAKHILGFWEGSTKENICLLDVVNSLKTYSHSYLKTSAPAQLSLRFLSILLAIPGFSFRQTGGYLQWEYQT